VGRGGCCLHSGGPRHRRRGCHSPLLPPNRDTDKSNPATQRKKEEQEGIEKVGHKQVRVQRYLQGLCTGRANRGPGLCKGEGSCKQGSWAVQGSRPVQTRVVGCARVKGHANKGQGLCKGQGMCKNRSMAMQTRVKGCARVMGCAKKGQWPYKQGSMAVQGSRSVQG
jgi:hypothetical protein